MKNKEDFTTGDVKNNTFLFSLQNVELTEKV